MHRHIYIYVFIHLVETKIFRKVYFIFLLDFPKGNYVLAFKEIDRTYLRNFTINTN